MKLAHKTLLVALVVFLIVSPVSTPQDEPSFDYAAYVSTQDHIKQLELENGELLRVAHHLNSFYNKSSLDGIDITDNNRAATVKICADGCSWFVFCETHSMSPTFTCNDELYGFKPAKDEIAVGDIVIYTNREERRNILHRVIGIEGEYYIMKGDNNEQVDDYTPTYDDIIFKIARIDYK